jgi:2,4-dichlorophenol 6-monooxygenase
VLVRPDGYVALRYQDSTNAAFDYENTLKAVLKQIQLNLFKYKQYKMALNKSHF